MFEFKVLGLSEAGVEIYRQWPTKIVSLVSRHLPLPQQSDHLIIHVEDVHSEEGDDYPTAEMVESILNYAKSFTDEDRVMVHCFAGQSRSTAAMIAILIGSGMDWRSAHDAVVANRAVALPNQLIIRLLDEHFEFAGELIEYNNTYVSFKLREKHVSVITDPVGSGISEAQVSAMRDIMNLFD